MDHLQWKFRFNSFHSFWFLDALYLPIFLVSKFYIFEIFLFAANHGDKNAIQILINIMVM
jgi:hypothetical protein